MVFPLATFFSGQDIFVILIIALLLFGVKRIPELMGALAKGINEFKKVSGQATADLQQAINAPVTPEPPAEPKIEPAAPVETPEAEKKA
jgi:TatA/E family protein of Tat protein translocase